MNWINNYTYNPQDYTGGPYPWKYGGYNGYRGYSSGGQGGPFGDRDMGYVDHKQSGVGVYYNKSGGSYNNNNVPAARAQVNSVGYNQGNSMGGNGIGVGCGASRAQFGTGIVGDGDPFNPFDDDYRGGLGWNLRRRR